MKARRLIIAGLFVVVFAMLVIARWPTEPSHEVPRGSTAAVDARAAEPSGGTDPGFFHSLARTVSDFVRPSAIAPRLEEKDADQPPPTGIVGIVRSGQGSTTIEPAADRRVVMDPREQIEVQLNRELFNTHQPINVRALTGA